MKLGFSTLALNAALAGFLAPAALAQAVDNPFVRHRFTAVTERSQPEYDPRPVHAGAFVVDSSLGVGANFNDNIYATQSNKTSDTIVTVDPRVDVRSNWSVNEIDAGLSVDEQRYIDNDSQSVLNYDGYVGGRLDATRSLSFNGRLAGGRYTEGRYAPASQQTNPNKPVRFDQTGGQVGAVYRFNRIQLEGNFGETKYDYSGAAQSYRDYTSTDFGGRASYALSPDVALYLQGRHADLSYDTASTPSRDGKRTFVQAGTNFELAAPFRGDIAVGYVKDEKDVAPVPGAPKSFDGLSLNGRLQWFPTQITTVTFTGVRDVFDPGLVNSSVAFNTNFGAHVDHELRRNIVIFGEAFYGQQDFKDIDRKDNITTASLGLAYKLNPHARVELAYSLRDQQSKGAQRDHDLNQNILGVSLKIYP